MTPLVARFLSDLSDRTGGPHGLSGAQGVGLWYGLAARLSLEEGPAALLVAGESAGLKLHGFLKALLGERGAPAWLPEPDADPYEGLPNHPGVLLQRALALTTLCLDPRPRMLVSSGGFLYRVPKVGHWKSRLRLLEEDQPLDRRELRVSLWEAGYRQVDLVGEPGEAAFRGGIVDIFTPAESLPVRAELFGDEIESLRYFDPATQHSLGAVGRPVLVPPLSEAVRDEGAIQNLRCALADSGEFGEVRLEGLNRAGTYPSLDSEIRQDAAFFGSVSEFLGAARWTVVDPDAVLREAAQRIQGFRDSFTRHRRPAFLEPSRLFLAHQELQVLVQDPRTLLVGRPSQPGVPSERPPLFPGEPFTLLAHIRERVRDGCRCLALLQGQGTLDRLSELALAQDLVLHRETPGAAEIPPGFYAAVAPVEEGVLFPGARWLVITEKEIFGRGKVLPEARVQRREAFATGLRDLKAGDPVVHVEHGVGLYQGIETLVRAGLREDYLILTYAGGSRLLVPVQRMDLIERYVGHEGHRPALDRLGGSSWRKTKEKVRKAVREIAGDLLRLYATRRTVEGFRFSGDSDWQREFEAQFPYELTADQERAVLDVKADMESPKPMDRLVCGDVGFGKTEVAMRAAFKAVTDGRQVAILCPTTVLALQHTERFSERFAPFPVRIGMLSRFVSKSEQKLLVQTATAGDLDILIGTHRILSKDVDLPKLGLLVVDEEQRFGVAHKERIKQLKSRVDVLTLTATPIPRTLQMGLSGLTDMSLIQTPPKDRLSIQTSLQAYDPELVQVAIRRELVRGGQVYYVHNTIESIAAAARRIQEMVPEARVTAAHGRMSEKALEEVMMAFFHGRYDLLVCTTIIENGVDLPRVNTLFVEDAQDFGLCQLYQLRGRIGRSDVPAYAYLMTPPGIVLQGDAERRLETLREFTELGAGFRVAAADLEIRGAGNLLGAEQSGHMAAVGFEMYIRMLEEAVSEAKGETPVLAARCETSLGLDLSVPSSYMEDVNQRLGFYRQLSMAAREADVDKVSSETQDRFGPLPEAVSRMMEAVRLRIRAERLLIRSIAAKGGLLTLHFDPSAPFDTTGLVRFLSARRGARLNPAGSLEVSLAPGEDTLRLLGALLQASSPSAEAPA